MKRSTCLKRGESFRLLDFDCTILALDGTSITQVRLTKRKPEDDADEEDSA